MIVVRPTALTAKSHATLRQLIHLADGVGGPMEEWASGSFRETLPLSSPFPTALIWWTDNTKVAKIVQKDITFDSNKNPIMVRWSAYKVDGLTVLHQVTDVISYVGPFEISRIRTVI